MLLPSPHPFPLPRPLLPLSPALIYMAVVFNGCFVVVCLHISKNVRLLRAMYDALHARKVISLI